MKRGERGLLTLANGDKIILGISIPDIRTTLFQDMIKGTMQNVREGDRERRRR